MTLQRNGAVTASVTWDGVVAGAVAGHRRQLRNGVLRDGNDAVTGGLRVRTIKCTMDILYIPHVYTDSIPDGDVEACRSSFLVRPGSLLIDFVRPRKSSRKNAPTRPADQNLRAS